MPFVTYDDNTDATYGNWLRKLGGAHLRAQARCILEASVAATDAHRSALLVAQWKLRRNEQLYLLNIRLN